MERLVGLLLHLVLVSAALEVIPVSQVVQEGSSTSVTCAATGARAISWRHNDQAITDGVDGFSVSASPPSNSSTLAIPSADHDLHHGVYMCEAELQDGTIDVENFSISVHFLDSFTQEVQVKRDECHTTVLVDTNVTLICTPPSGYPEPTISWLYEDNPILETNRNIAFEDNERSLILVNIKFSDAGFYKCEAANNVSSVRSERLDVRVEDRATQDPMLSILDGGDVLYAKRGGSTSMSCKILPQPTSEDLGLVRWKLDNQPITSGDGYNLPFHDCFFTLEIVDVNESHEGTYTCNFRAQTDQRDLQIAKLNSAYEVAFNPSSLVGVGQSVQMRCSPAGLPGNVNNATYSWLFTPPGSTMEPAAVSDDDGRVMVREEGGEVGVLEIQNVSLSDAGSYTCVAAHPLVEPVLTSTLLEVEASPDVSLQPSGTGGVLRHSLSCDLSFICRSSSQHNAVFIWSLNNGPLSSSSITSSCGPGCGNLTVVGLTASALGHYTCTVSDDIHLTQSLSVEVRETEDLYFRGDGCNVTEVDKTFVLNEPVQLECLIGGAPSSIANASFTWFRGNEKLDNSLDRVTVSTEEGEGRSAVTIESASVERDEADYFCVVEEASGNKIILTFDVFITIRPQIESHPGDIVEAVEGQRLRLQCTASGRPTPIIKWLFSSTGTFLSSTSDGRVVVLSSGVLIFDPVRQSDDGEYRCIAQQTVPNRNTQVPFELMVESASSSDEFTIGSLNEQETLLVICVVVASLVLLLLTCLICLITCCYCQHQRRRKTYAIGNDRDRIGDQLQFKRQPSLRRDNSGVLLSTSPANFFGLSTAEAFEMDMHDSPSPAPEAFYPPTSSTITHTPSYPLMSYGQEESLISDLSRSPSPTPAPPSPIPNNTVVSDSMFSMDEASIATSLPNFPRANLKHGEVMGDGEFGPVLLATARNILPHEEKTLVAVKALLLRNEEEDHIWVDATLVEFANQMKLEHANISSIIGMCTEMEPFYIIYEYLDKGDLKKFLMSSRPYEGEIPTLSQQNLQRIIWQVADGMSYLFSQRIIHGDLATRNCLVSSDLRVKISDLGIGHDLYGADYYDNGTQLLPIRWMPPELLMSSDEGPHFSLYSDIWSFGVLCWEVFTFARLPYEDLNDEQVLEDVPNGLSLPVAMEGCPLSLYAVMQDCWRRAPSERPHFSKLCAAIHSLELEQ